MEFLKKKIEKWKESIRKTDKEEIKKTFLIICSIAIVICTLIIAIYYYQVIKVERHQEQLILTQEKAIAKENERLAKEEREKQEREEKERQAYLKNKRNKKNSSLSFWDRNNNTSNSNNDYDYDEDNQENQEDIDNENNPSADSERDLRNKDNQGSYLNEETRFDEFRGDSRSNSAKDKDSGQVQQDKKDSERTKSPQEIQAMIMKDRKAMLSDVRIKLAKYVNKEGSKYSVMNALKRNIDIRNEYIEYMQKEGLSGTEILKSDNRKDEEFLEELSRNSRTYFFDYNY